MNRNDPAYQETVIALQGAGQPLGLVGRLAAAEAELRELAERAKEAHRAYRDLDQQVTALAAEVKDLRFQIREEANR